MGWGCSVPFSVGTAWVGWATVEESFEGECGDSAKPTLPSSSTEFLATEEIWRVQALKHSNKSLLRRRLGQQGQDSFARFTVLRESFYS